MTAFILGPINEYVVMPASSSNGKPRLSTNSCRVSGLSMTKGQKDDPSPRISSCGFISLSKTKCIQNLIGVQHMKLDIEGSTNSLRPRAINFAYIFFALQQLVNPT